MGRPTSPAKASGSTRGATDRPVRLRGARLLQTEVDGAADAEEAETGREAGPRGVHRRLGERGSLSTVVKFLRLRREGIEAVPDIREDRHPGGSDPGGRKRGERGRSGEGTSTSDVYLRALLERMTFENSRLERLIREQGKALGELADRMRIVEVAQSRPEGSGAVTGSTLPEGAAPHAPTASARQDAPKVPRYRTDGPSRQDRDALLVEVIGVITARGGVARRRDLYEGLSESSREGIDESRFFDFVKSRGKLGTALRNNGGAYTLGPDAKRFLRAHKTNDASNNTGVIATNQRSVSQPFARAAIRHLHENQGGRFSIEDLFEVADQKVAKGMLSRDVMTVKRLYNSLYAKADREAKAEASGKRLPKGRTIVFSRDRTFTAP